MHDFTMPIGPQTPAIKEPTCLRISVDGNYIKSAKIRLGYAHRGIEKLLEEKDVNKALHISSHICGICTFAHSGCYVQTIEKMMEYDAPEKVKLLRVLIAELERIHSHLLWAGYMMHEIGYETMFMYFWRERERILDVFEKITGGRVHHSFNRIGTVRNDLKEEDKLFIRKQLNPVEKNILKYFDEINTHHVVKARLKDVGIIPEQDVKKFCLVGPMARGSGVKSDIRKKEPYEAYAGLNFLEIFETKGDALARTNVRLKEIIESKKIIEQVLEKIGKEKIPKTFLAKVPDREGMGRVEAPRGENFYFIKTKNNVIERARIRPPTYANIKILEEMLVGCEIGDVPVIVASIDPCFGCLERVMVVKKNRKEIMTEQEFRGRYVCVK